MAEFEILSAILLSKSPFDLQASEVVAAFNMKTRQTNESIHPYFLPWVARGLASFHGPAENRVYSMTDKQRADFRNLLFITLAEANVNNPF
jgi:hypothetical protein